MTVQSLKLDLPETVMQRLQQAADAMQRPLEEVIEQTITGNLPPLPSDLPSAFQTEFAILQRADERALWHLAQETLPTDQWAHHEELLNRQQEGHLSDAERQTLNQLRQQADLFVMRRSYVLALLKWRGRTLPAVTVNVP